MHVYVHVYTDAVAGIERSLPLADLSYSLNASQLVRQPASERTVKQFYDFSRHRSRCEWNRQTGKFPLMLFESWHASGVRFGNLISRCKRLTYDASALINACFTLEQGKYLRISIWKIFVSKYIRYIKDSRCKLLWKFLIKMNGKFILQMYRNLSNEVYCHK